MKMFRNKEKEALTNSEKATKSKKIVPANNKF
jgi:hypothetical protein